MTPRKKAKVGLVRLWNWSTIVVRYAQAYPLHPRCCRTEYFF